MKTKKGVKIKKIRKDVTESLDKISEDLQTLLVDVSKHDTVFTEISNSDLTNIFKMKERLKHMSNRIKN